MERNIPASVPNDREELKKAILEIADNLELEHLRMLYITAKIWENRFRATET